MNAWYTYMAAMAAGAALGVAAGFLVGRVKKYLSARKKGGEAKKWRPGTINTVLILEAIFLLYYVNRVLTIFEITGNEPQVLNTCVFTVCGFENGFLGWIQTTKIKKGGTKAEEPTIGPERPEPPDA